MASKHQPFDRAEQSTAARDFIRGLVECVRVSLAAGCVLGFAWGVESVAHGAPITSDSFRIEVKNSSVWYDSQGNLVANGGAGSRLSVLERWNLLSQPIVSITNLSTNTSLIGAQLDLSNSASKIISCTWLEAPATSTWNWDDPSASALFQFGSPIAPGGVVTMRLGTAARENSQGLTYSMNQTLFHPCIGDCLTTNTSFGAFTLFYRPSGQASGSHSTQPLSFANQPLVGNQITSTSASSTSFVPVPEPQAVALAASAVGIVVGWRGLRRRAN